ncbi:DNA polymerase III subunit gamma/tau [Acidithiobacillus sp. CV18-2]|uniref:DNA polymerase III subunit gamma/tau n=1 Tax=Igneacidithiobacillus copahuensis TaxID=2724909 RepID=A0AAE2YSB9_9PROT|nr:DNA polymerase III subunit gamma/tau [Igneacidithiobacillus copahuensis]MBU2753883.1 DNA polymerase III subunit gamma/tau [Acidithiobacillus sp. CV18-3]MBU2757419.1 DNA polymerase III subunit gamma/tau [Acidithiobacillus sp. BN09-2]MBU2777309.1 DNA polymerase III subunit gamma/tau [Acidithiobacillus sp. CV18-2]MBU2796208.1 DNA polymerase III subunit gamma/tau [Acidithiobacillus sp. VAN18-2]MBU2798409.1 DNA polymerase III subunit gamma/tau [Acidithiobacillus sp. VAN18-4]
MAGVYQALARRWRPQSFADFVGQETVVKSLRHALDSGRLHHAFLFTGTRGVGKTTLARLLAKCLNCERGVSSEPCGECSACKSIVAGSFVDLLEVDAASRTRVDETRELLDNVQYAATNGRYKVYLIDEVHMLSTHSFNALLKTLEEPPEHVKFLLATTDPQKIPATILSRCIQFHLRRLEAPLIVQRLRQILVAEGVEAADDALEALAQAADGSLRDALSLTDQAIAQGGGRVDGDTVTAMLGLCPGEVATSFLIALLQRDSGQVFALLREQQALGQDAAALLDAIIEELHRCSLAQWLPEQRGALAAQLRDLVQQESPLLLQSWYHILLTARRDFSLYPNPRMAIEMALLRLLVFLLPEGPPERSKNVAEPREPNPVAATRGAAADLPTDNRATAPAAKLLPTPEAVEREEAPEGRAPEAPLLHADPQRAWEELLPKLSLSPSLREFLRHSRALRCDRSALELALDPAYESLLRKEEGTLRTALQNHWQAATDLRLTLLDSSAAKGTLAQEATAREQARRAEIEARALADPRLKEFQEVLQARVLRVEIMDQASNS